MKKHLKDIKGIFSIKKQIYNFPLELKWTSVKDFILFISLLKGEPVRCYNWYKGEIKGA